MAIAEHKIAEHETAPELRLRLSRQQRETLVQAASAAGQTIDEFAAATLLQAAEAAQKNHPLDKVIGIFKDEPLMDALMERVRADRQKEIESGMIESGMAE